MRRLAHLSIVVLLVSITPVFSDVAIVKSAGSFAFNDARNGFASICFENRQEFDLAEDGSNQGQILEGIKSGNYRLMVAIGSQASSFLKANFPDIPLIYCLVVNPEKLGLKGANIAGVPLNVPVREQFALLKTIFKKTKRLGVLYTQPANDGLIASARSVAEDAGMTLVASPITSSQDIQKAMTDLIGKCDALWIPPDPSLNSEEVIRYIGTTSLSRQIPCVGPNDRFVRAGAVFSLSVDAIEVGRAAGDLANKILQGTPVSKLSTPDLQKPKIILNLKAAGLLNISIPRNIQDTASKVYQ